MKKLLCLLCLVAVLGLSYPSHPAQAAISSFCSTVDLDRDRPILKMFTFEVPLPNYDRFRAATVTNQQKSVQEAGVIRFPDRDENGVSYFVDEQQQKYVKVVYLEGYRQAEDFERHKQTEHFGEWYQTIGKLLRSGTQPFKQDLIPLCGKQ
jgi:quinol monooxygenase YgiN